MEKEQEDKNAVLSEWRLSHRILSFFSIEKDMLDLVQFFYTVKCCLCTGKRRMNRNT